MSAAVWSSAASNAIAEAPQADDGGQSESAGDDDAPFGDLLKGLEGIEREKPSRDKDSESKASSDIEASTGPGGATRGEQSAPPLFVARQAMGEATRLLSDKRSAEAAPNAQQQAIEALDQFIEQAMAAASEASSSDAQKSQRQSGQPQAGSESASQEGEQPGEDASQGKPSGSEQPGDGAGGRPAQTPESSPDDVAGPRAESLDDAVWGHLPQRLRERLQAAMPEEFLPAYEQAIRDYFTRLSEMSDADGR